MANILVLDDDLTLLEQLKVLLNTLGHTPRLSIESKYFFEQLKNETCDLILMDIHMPEINGIELLRQLKSQLVYQAIPVIMLTIDPDEQLLEQCFESGAADFINKPVSKTVLKARINAILKVKVYQEQLIEKNRQLEQTAHELQRSQHRLAKILDIAEDAIITVNETKQINFFNQRAEEILGYSTEEVLGQSLDLLISPESIDTTKWETANIVSDEYHLSPFKEKNFIKVYPKNQIQRLMETSIFNLNLGDETISVLILHKDVSSLPEQSSGTTLQISSKAELTEELQRERQRIQVLSDAFDGVVKLFSQGGETLIRELRNVDQTLDSMNQYLSEESQTEELREMLVHVLSLSLDYWEKTTDKTKVELAEESRIWRVYLDQNTVRTRTLDRYLSLETLPQKPRWKDVLNTAHYVLTHCPSTQPLQSELETTVSKLQNLLRTKIG